MLTEEQKQKLAAAEAEYREACMAYAPIYMESAAAQDMSKDQIAALVDRMTKATEAYYALLGIKTLEQEAIDTGNNRKSLYDRLSAAKKCLKPEYKKHFRPGEFDFEGKRLVGTNGYVLQWKVRHYPNLPISYFNQQTSQGSVGLEHTQYKWYVGHANTDQGHTLTVFECSFEPTDETHGNLYGFVFGGFETRREVVESVESWLRGTNGRNILTNFSITDDHHLILK